MNNFDMYKKLKHIIDCSKDSFHRKTKFHINGYPCTESEEECIGREVCGLVKDIEQQALEKHVKQMLSVL